MCDSARPRNINLDTAKTGLFHEKGLKPKLETSSISELTLMPTLHFFLFLFKAWLNINPTQKRNGFYPQI